VTDVSTDGSRRLSKCQTSIINEILCHYFCAARFHRPTARGLCLTVVTLLSVLPVLFVLVLEGFVYHSALRVVICRLLCVKPPRTLRTLGCCTEMLECRRHDASDVDIGAGLRPGGWGPLPSRTACFSSRVL